jgi:hypothetical protein
MRCLILLLTFFIYSFFPVCAQQTVQSVIGDSIRLNAGSYRGNIQWQRSFNNMEWIDINSSTYSLLKQKVEILPIYFRARVDEQNCAPHFSEVIAFQTSAIKRWSDAATWNGSKPVAGQDVTIPEGTSILLDENTPSLGGLTINGTLAFARQNVSLTAKYILIHGKLEVGTEENPFTDSATITVTGDNTSENIMGMGTRGLLIMDGTIELHGLAPTPIWTKLNAHAAKDATQIEIKDDVNWKMGDEIALAPTDYFLAGNGIAISQRVSITNISEKTITVNTGLNSFRWGLLQYPTASGMSLSPAAIVSPPSPDTAEKKTPLVLDERAEVGHLTRNIVIQSPNDALWTTQGFGVHVMVMGSQAIAHVEGVEIKRGGQRGRLARYPFHWHQHSYAGTQTLNDATGQYFRKSSINTSANRGVVIHGTNGVTIKDNVIFDIKGHAVFTEDAVERRNIIDGNLVLYVRNSSQPLKIHEGAGGAERGSSGFWISNPDNVIINNIAADCRSNGFWLPFPAQPWGLNNSVLDTRDGLLLNPSRLQFGVFTNNVAHSNGLEGILLDEVEIDNSGTTFPFQYYSTTNGRNPVWPNTTLRRFTLSNYSVWKNSDNGIWDRSTWPDNYGIVSADNCGRFFAGSGADGVIEHSLIVGTSLNHLMNGTGRPAGSDYSAGYSSSDPVAFATYHSSFDIRNNIVINFPAAANKRSGVFAMDDYYLRPVEKGQYRNINNLSINSHSGVRLTALYNWFTLASALWDYHGTWGPAQNFLVYDVPFLTYGKTTTIIQPGTAVAGSVSVSGPFYGFEGFVLHGVGDTPPQNQPYFDLMGIHVRRLDNSLNEVGTWTIQPAPNSQALLQHMRHFAASPDGIYDLSFPQELIHPTDFQMNVDNMLNVSDQVVMGIQYDGTLNATVRMRSVNDFDNYVSVASLDAVRQSAGATYWQDKPNNKVWIKIRGGFWRFWTTNPNEAIPSSDELLYKSTILQIRPQ